MNGNHVENAPFEFLSVGPLSDGDLQLVLAECQPGERSVWGVPAYIFHMRNAVSGKVMGRITLRLGQTHDVTHFYGHIGYAVEPSYRGQHFAERACRLILPLARSHGLHELWITTGPENAPSRRTIERLGGVLVDIVDVPDDYPLPAGAIRKKCRYRI